MARLKVLYTAAHAGAGPQVPIGGGGAISRLLLDAWQTSNTLDVEVIRPADDRPEQIVSYSPWEYTAFCHRFRRQVTETILNYDPRDVVILCNDISEGPDFALLAARGYRMVTIWHVDVVAFVARMYLKNLLRPARLAAWLRPFESYLPGPLHLVFTQQHACVRHSVAHVVMTDAMKNTILDCYPSTAPSKVHVIPWGAPPQSHEGKRRRTEIPTLLMLSRISPEKGQHRLLEALRDWPTPLRVILAGEAAFMGGAAYRQHLQGLADSLRHVRVEFPGHLSGQAKADAFANADLYVFPSISESYGLTLMEALSYGVPSIAFDHDGARAILQPDCGVLVQSPAQLRTAIASLLQDTARRSAMSAAAREFAHCRPFARAAESVASLLLGVAKLSA